MDMERTDVILNGGEEIIDGSIPLQIRKKYIPSLAKAIQHTSTLHITGSLHYITDQLLQLIEESL